MADTEKPRRHILTSIVIVGLLALCGYLYVRPAMQSIHEAFAEEQIQIIQDCRDRALHATSAGQVAGLLGYAAGYYPSGTKQREGSRLDRIVETQRKRAVADMIAHLRELTGQNLGDAPEPWIKKYAE